jgi:hypothetical protein
LVVTSCLLVVDGDQELLLVSIAAI